MDEARSRPRLDDDEMNLLDYWRIVRRRLRLIVVLSLVAVLATMGISLWLPKMYRSTVTVLAPLEGNAGGLGLASALSSSSVVQALPGLSIPFVTSQRDIFMSVLKSRTMAEAVVTRFQLQERYEAEFLADAIKTLQQMATVSLSKDGVITVQVEDTDPALAAAMANFFVEHLDYLLRRFDITEASKQRAFIAERLAETVHELHRAEEALRRFQETNQAIALEEQAKGAVETVALLKGEIMASEVQLEVVRKFATEANPEVIKLKRRIEEMKRHMSQLQYGKGWILPSESRNPGQPRNEIHIPFVQVPEVGLELARLTRDFKVQETVFSLLTQQLEQAKISEARDVPTVRILDKAVPADRKSKPNIKFNMAVAGIISLFIGVLLAFFLEYLAALKRSSLPQA